MMSQLHKNNHGLTTGQDGKLDILWMTGSPAPQAILEFISCKCSRICQLPGCQCLSNGLKCTEECRLQNCSNMKDADEDDSIQDVLDEDDEDDNDAYD
jgi:hypothetical protein